MKKKYPYNLFLQLSLFAYGSIVFLIACNGKGRSHPAEPIAALPKGLDSTVMVQIIADHVQINAQNKKSFYVQDSLELWKKIDSLYKSAPGKLFWIDAITGLPSSAIEGLKDVINNASFHGLNSQHYGWEIIKDIPPATPADSVEANTKLADATTRDALLSAAFLAYAADLYDGRIKTKWEVEPKPRDYIADLKNTAASGEVKKYFDSIMPENPAYLEMLNGLKYLTDAQKNGGLPIIKSGLSYEKGKTGTHISDLIHYLALTGDLTMSHEAEIFNDAVSEALRHYQKRNGLSSSGKMDGATMAKMNRPLQEVIDKLSLNIERMRWLPHGMGKKYAWVNIPEYMLYVFEDYKPVFESIVVVGDPAKQTPIILKPMTHIVFSPVWNVPSQIGREEIQRWLHINPNLLIVAGVEVFFKGKKVEDPLAIKWTPELAKSKDYSFKVKPSANNALGDVKFMFPNHHNVYLHDTNNKTAFNEANRAQSAGCIRVQKPVEFAEVLLAPQNWSRQNILSKMGTGKEMSVNLKEKIPVYLYYLTNYIDRDGLLRDKPDVYGHDKKQLAVWKQYATPSPSVATP